MADSYYDGLFDLTLLRTDFHWIGDRSHAHCDLCWREFNEDVAMGLTWGYATEDERIWICPACLAEERERCRWKVVE